MYSRRDLHSITTLAGMWSNAVLGKALKRLFRQGRPAATCALLGICHKHGMPSSHAQLMAFVWALHALMLSGHRWPADAAQQGIHIVESALLGLAWAAVGYARVYLGYHDTWQARPQVGLYACNETAMQRCG